MYSIIRLTRVSAVYIPAVDHVTLTRGASSVLALGWVLPSHNMKLIIIVEHVTALTKYRNSWQGTEFLNYSVGLKKSRVCKISMNILKRIY